MNLYSLVSLTLSFGCISRHFIHLVTASQKGQRWFSPNDSYFSFQAESEGSRSGSSLSLRNIASQGAGGLGNVGSGQSPSHHGGTAASGSGGGGGGGTGGAGGGASSNGGGGGASSSAAAAAAVHHRGVQRSISATSSKARRGSTGAQMGAAAAANNTKNAEASVGLLAANANAAAAMANVMMTKAAASEEQNSLREIVAAVGGGGGKFDHLRVGLKPFVGYPVYTSNKFHLDDTWQHLTITDAHRKQRVKCRSILL
jgi:hypothetical protein